MQYSRILIVLMTLIMGALAAPLRQTRDAEVSYGNPKKVWYSGNSLRLEYREKANHDEACKDSEWCNIKLTSGDFKWIDEDWGNPDLVTYQANITPKRIKFNYGDAKGNWCGDHYICYLNAEVAPRP